MIRESESTQGVHDQQLTGVKLLDHVLAGSMSSDYPPRPDTGTLDRVPPAKKPQSVSLAFAVTVAVIGATLASAAAGQAHVHASNARAKAQLLAHVQAAKDELAAAERANAALAATNQNMAVRILNQSSEGARLQTAISAQGPTAAATEVRGMAGCSTFTRDRKRLTDRQVQALVNAIWRSGPIAASVSDIRLTSRSAIRSAGSQLLVGYQPASEPTRLCALYGSSNETQAQRGFDEIDRWASAFGLRTRHSMTIMTFPPASDKMVRIDYARSE